LNKSVQTYHKVLFLGARLMFVIFFLMTSSYCLLAYVPFTYQWVINCTLVKWLPVFVTLHPYLYCVVVALVGLTLIPDLRDSGTRRLAIGFIGCHVIAGASLLVHPLLSSLANNDRSYYWSLISLIPLLWLALIDHTATNRDRKWSQSRDGHITISTVLMAAGYVSLLYAGSIYLRFGWTGGVPLRLSELVVGLSASLASHLFLFTLAFLGFRLIRSFAARFDSGARIEFLLCNCVVALLGVLLIRLMILPALTFSNRSADLFAIAVSFSVVALMSGLSLRLQPANEAISSGFSLTLAPLLIVSPRENQRWLFRAAFLVVISTAAYLIPAAVAKRDWDFLIQKLGVITIWALVFAFFCSMRLRRTQRNYSVATLLLVGLVTGGWYSILASTRPLWPSIVRDEHLDVSATLERYSNYDLSFKLVSNILGPKGSLFSSTAAPTNDGSSAAAIDPSFYGFLEQNTNLMPSVKVSPVEINLAPEIEPAGGDKPNIFIFVIDSLRQDYVSPYNRAVSFTPNIESFARESLVMKNAFTRYGGTVLAEPSIWTGTLQLHKQYIEPYYPMNSLQRLIETEGYESFITIDPVVRIITKPSSDVIELDKDNLWFEYDFCRTLQELQNKIGERETGARPMFVYTEPQNVHRVVLKDKGEPVPAGEHYPGFYAPYAAQVKYMDRCFGEFIAFLKSSGLYENSIVILTSDHGDSLGEGGRWGHSYWMFPEILRIPLLIHLPAGMQRGLTSDLKAVAFTTDITPTLYYLLGRRPIARNPMFGRPLITTTEKEHNNYLQKSYLVASSYGPVYGILSEEGRSLFIADAVNRTSYFFNLADDPKATRNKLTAPIQSENEKLIREMVESINQFYNVGEGR
jgi:hypothetical protein